MRTTKLVQYRAVRRQFRLDDAGRLERYNRKYGRWMLVGKYPHDSENITVTRNFSLPRARLVYTLHTREDLLPELDILHLDGNRRNNHPSNLEAVTRRELHQRRDRGGRLCGATKLSGRGQWMARAKVNGETIYLGQHDTEGAAHTAYELALAVLLPQ